MELTQPLQQPLQIFMSMDSSGNDNWNGLNSTWVNTTNGPKATIQNATGTVGSKGTVKIASGTYNENNIEIKSNMNIIGENQQNTIINGQGSGNQIFIIDSGVKVTLEDLTFTNTNASAIENNGILNIINCSFINDNAVNGGAINNTGTLDISDSTFNNDTSTVDNMASGGGAIYNSGNLNIKNSSFNNDTSQGSGLGMGGAIANTGNLNIDNSSFNDNGFNSWDGGVLSNTGNLNITNSSFFNNTCWDGGVIFNYYDGVCIITGSDFDSNNAGTYAGVMENDGSLVATNDKFTNNLVLYDGGGAIAILGPATLNGCTFTGNNADGTYYGGGALLVYAANVNINNCIFINNTASYGGAVYTTQGLNLNLTNSTLLDNNATDGAALYNDGAFDIVQFNRIIGNTGSSQVYNLDADIGKVDARYNWWGSNSDPSAGIIGTGVTYKPWIVLTLNTTPVIGNTGTSDVSAADLLYDSGILSDPKHPDLYYHAPGLGHVPDGLAVSFVTESEYGNINPETNTTMNGTADTTFTRIADGVSDISATVDNQTVTNNILNPTVTVVDSATGTNGKTVTITATLKDSYGNPLAGQNVIFSIKGIEYSAITKSNGIATIQYLLNGAGNYNITVNYSGNITYYGSQGTGLLTINSTPVTPVNPVTPVTPSKPSTDPTISAYPTTANATITSVTIPMQHTGLPIAGLIVAILSVLGGTIMSRRK